MALVTNKKALFNYEIIDKYEAGLVLEGYEVKALRAGRGQINSAYISLLGGEVFLRGLVVTPIQLKNTPMSYKEGRTVKLLLNKDEIKDLYKKTEAKGVTIVPISIYESRGKIKCEMAIVRGLKKQDKRHKIKEREDKIEIQRTLKSKY